MDGLVFTDADSSGAVAICKETSRQRATYPSNDKHLMTMENYFTESTSQPPFNLTWKTNYPGSEPGFSFRLSFFFFFFCVQTPSGLYSAYVTDACLRHITEVVVVKS